MEFQNADHDAVIVLAHRTAVGRAKKGGFALTRPDDLLTQLLAATVARAKELGLDPNAIDDVLVGCAMPEGEQGLNVARIAALGAGLPETVSAVTVNRFCASGIETIAGAAAKIAVGHADVILAGGVESMSMVPMSGNKPTMSPAIAASAPEVYTPMGITAENVAEKYGVDRAAQDQFALASHQKATRAVEEGRFKGEILPVLGAAYDEKGARADRIIDRDEGIRPDTTVEALGALKPAFKAQGGTVTAGNSSQVSDGAAASLLMSRKTAAALGLAPLATLRAYATVGVDPALMGIGPVPAIRKLLARAGGKIEDVDVFEINEAFASQAIYCQRELGIADERLNPNGGAIALGHPLGCTGARMTATLLAELRRRDGRFGVVSMCVGGGQGAAALFERA